MEEEEDVSRERERERTGCRKLEGRRSRPGLVLGLADSLALSRRNASNAGEPLLYLSFFNARSPSSVRLRPQASTFLHPAAILRGLHPPPPPPLSLSFTNLPFIQFTLSFGEATTHATALSLAYHSNLSLCPSLFPPAFPARFRVH